MYMYVCTYVCMYIHMGGGSPSTSPLRRERGEREPPSTASTVRADPSAAQAREPPPVYDPTCTPSPACLYALACSTPTYIPSLCACARVGVPSSPPDAAAAANSIAFRRKCPGPSVRGGLAPHAHIAASAMAACEMRESRTAAGCCRRLRAMLKGDYQDMVFGHIPCSSSKCHSALL
jgi:hypothetical protein